ncbi:hypothetical protein J2Z21_002849 [Streptomyces griseochromogenes]|uniref:Uncharacterized protein n=1 Tax=Streptomyces griseochromogenes TaxID=68214 RepID=A0ABS4LR84_9ACTN|nr:hypothetical protein [Streptomyces griseochromogenes]
MRTIRPTPTTTSADTSSYRRMPDTYGQGAVDNDVTLKQWRCPAMHPDKPAVAHQGALHLTAILIRARG